MAEKECIHETDIEEMKRRDQKQDDNHEELKAMVQELSAKQDDTDRKIEALWEHLDNGYQENLSNKVTDKLFEMLKLLNEHNFGLKKQKEENRTTIKVKTIVIVGSIITTLCTAGGLFYMAVENAIKNLTR